MPHQDGRSLGLLYDTERRGHIIRKMGCERKLWCVNGIAFFKQQRDDSAVAGSIGPDAVDQDDVDAVRADGGSEFNTGLALS